ncbi:MAG: hypothetical protein ACRBN8_27620 [Nannocystales bacterium]
MTARLPFCALLAALSLGCATSNDTASEPRAAEAPSNPGEAEARAVVLEGDLDASTLHALAKHLEGLAEIQSVELAIEQANDGPTRARLTLAGLDMPSPDELQVAVADFDGLGDASVSIEDAAVPHGPVDAEGIAIAADKDKTPDEVKAEVIEKLRADGVEGDIHVDVVDEDGERRVEVRLEQHEAQPE